VQGAGKFLPSAKDNAKGQLDSGINASVTSIPLKSGEGALFPQPYSGTASSAGTSTTLNDTGDLGNVSVGQIIWNKTDDSWAVITSIASAPDSITTTRLRGGSDNTWASGDEWVVDAFTVSLEKQTTATPPVVTDREKVLITGRTTDTLLAHSANGRGFDGSIALSFDADDYVRLNVESLHARNLHDLLADLAEIANGLQTDVESNDDDIADTQNDEPTWLGTITGTDTLTGTATPTRAAYTDGMRFAFVVANNNTGAVTLNVDSIGAEDVVAPDGSALVADDFVAGGIVEVRYSSDEDAFIMTSPKHATVSASTIELLTRLAGTVSGGRATTSEQTIMTVDVDDITDEDTYEFAVMGRFRVASGQTMTLRFKIGSTAIVSLALDSNNARPIVDVRGIIQVRSLGATGTAIGHITMHLNGVGGTNLELNAANTSTDADPSAQSAVTVDTTGTKALSLTVQSSSSSVDSHLSAHIGNIRRLRAA
jgi:hypothetical protein